MKARIIALALAASTVAVSARPAAAWEPATSAGIAEQAALASSLHKILISRFGLPGGLFAPLVVPPADAPELFVVLHQFLSPIDGFVPDGRGRLTALGWLVAGAVVADTPRSFAANHFFDPKTGKGLSERTLTGLTGKLRTWLIGVTVRESLIDSGVAAPDWIYNAHNSMSLAGFRDQYVKAVRARTEAARQRHLAGTLVAAGAILHVLADMGSPSHVRDDIAAHFDRIGRDASDVGSRFERVAALAYGRLGVPAPRRMRQRAQPRAYFSDADHQGLADVTSSRWFSAHTLPESFVKPRSRNPSDLKRAVVEHLTRPEPGPSLVVLPTEGKLTDESGVCLANFTEDGKHYRFWIGDDCALEQLAVILPQTASYAAGLLETLFAPTIAIEVEGGEVALRGTGAEFGSGRLTLFWDDDASIRTAYHDEQVLADAAHKLARSVPAPPGEAIRVSALFEGKDAAGAALVVAGSLSLREEVKEEKAEAPAKVAPEPLKKKKKSPVFPSLPSVGKPGDKASKEDSEEDDD
jgi:hypothetical protein